MTLPVRPPSSAAWQEALEEQSDRLGPEPLRPLGRVLAPAARRARVTCSYSRR